MTILDSRLQAAIEKLGFKKLTEIQQACLEPALEGRDFTARSATGTGKTAAFLLPILQKLLEKSGRQAPNKAIVIEPSRELAIQASNECRKLAHGTEVRCVAAYGGTPPKRQEELIAGGAQIVVGTPGRLRELMQKGVVKPGECRWLVLDEADRLLSGQFEKDTLYLASRLPKQRQTMLFSVQLPADKLKTAVQLLRPGFAQIKTGTTSGIALTHDYVIAENKPSALAKLLKKEKGKAMVFCTKSESAEKLRKDLKYFGISTLLLHAGLDSQKRHDTVRRFLQAGQKPEAVRDEFERILISTDLAARGVHFPKVARVVSFDLPAQPDFYLHRAGRTGRMGEKGACTSIVTARELPELRRILSYCGVEAGQAVV